MHNLNNETKTKIRRRELKDKTEQETIKTEKELMKIKHSNVII